MARPRMEEEGRPLFIHLIAIIGYGYLAFRMWPDIKTQLTKMRNNGVEGYAVFITCFFAAVVLIVMLCSFEVLKRIVKRRTGGPSSDSVDD